MCGSIIWLNRQHRGHCVFGKRHSFVWFWPLWAKLTRSTCQTPPFCWVDLVSSHHPWVINLIKKLLLVPTIINTTLKNHIIFLFGSINNYCIIRLLCLSTSNIMINSWTLFVRFLWVACSSSIWNHCLAKSSHRRFHGCYHFIVVNSHDIRFSALAPKILKNQTIWHPTR